MSVSASVRSSVPQAITLAVTTFLGPKMGSAERQEKDKIQMASISSVDVEPPLCGCLLLRNLGTRCPNPCRVRTEYAML